MLRVAFPWLLFILLTWLCLGSGPAAAGTTPREQPAPCASIVQDILGNRDRMIQVALVVVALGIAILMWRK